MQHAGEPGAEGPLRVSDEDVLAVYERAPVGIAICDLEGYFLRLNRWYAEVVGYSQEELLSRRFQDITLAEDVGPDLQQFEMLKAGRIESYEMERRFVRPDGRVVWAQLWSALVPLKAGGVGCVRTLADVTQRKLTEGALRESEALKAAILESALDAIITMDREGSVVDFNPAAERMFGYGAGEVVGRHLADAIIPERLRAAHWEGLRRFLETGHGPVLGRRIEVVGMRKGGSEFPVELAIAVTRTPSNVLFTAYLRDITDRKRWEAALESSSRELQRKAEELARSNEDLESFAAVIAHDLKEPLRGISTNLDLLVEMLAEPHEGVQARVDGAKRLARRMYDLLDALMAYSRVGRERLDVHPVDVRRLALEAAEQIEPLRAQAGAVIEVRADVPTLECDATLMRQVLANLLSNAIKYNRSAPPVVEVGGVDGNGLYVRDNGIGIDLRHQRSVFGMFKRLHRPEAYGGGVGVGLALVERIVQRHGGRIWLESAPGKGTTFYVELGGRAAPA